MQNGRRVQDERTAQDERRVRNKQMMQDRERIGEKKGRGRFRQMAAAVTAGILSVQLVGCQAAGTGKEQRMAEAKKQIQVSENYVDTVMDGRQNMEAAAPEPVSIKADDYKGWNKLREENEISEEFREALKQFAFQSGSIRWLWPDTGRREKQRHRFRGVWGSRIRRSWLPSAGSCIKNFIMKSSVCRSSIRSTGKEIIRVRSSWQILSGSVPALA